MQQVAATLGVQPNPQGAPNEHGHSERHTGKWWHAVDLVSSGHWRELLETAAFTTPRDITNAIGYGLTYSHHHGKREGRAYLTTVEAREIMREIDSPEPTDRVEALRTFSAPSPCKQDSGKVTWPVNSSLQTKTAAWAWSLVLCVEAGWFGYDRAGFLGWTEAGRNRFECLDSISYVEISGQSAFAF